jgi:hypothetical protein
MMFTSESEKMPLTSWHLKALTIVSLLAALAVYLTHLSESALTWPAIDSLPAVCRILDKDCLISDFFTNASSNTNPRLPYTYLLVALTALFDLGIGGGLAIVKSALLLFLPVLMTATVVISVHKQLQESLMISDIHGKLLWLLCCLVAPITVLVFGGEIGAILSVAWWEPILFDALPQNVSLALALSGFILLFFNFSFFSFALVFVAGVLHPPICLFACIFGSIIYSRNIFSIRANKSLLLFCFLPCLIATAFSVYFFSGGAKVSTADFIRVYVIEGHPSHYLPRAFGSLTKYPWYFSFSVIVIGLLVSSAMLAVLRCKAWRNALMAAAAYAGAVLFQYLFIEIWPIKLMAALGPSRFTMFGPWFLAIFLLLVVLLCISRVLRNHPLAGDITGFATRFLPGQVIFVLLIALGVLAVTYIGKGHNFEALGAQDKSFFKFVKSSTSKNDVLVLPFSSTRLYLPLLTGRGVFFGNGFPFSENYFLEYERRKVLVSGNSQTLRSIPGAWIGEKYANFYRSLTPEDFVKIAREFPLQWVVIEKRYSDKFVNCEISFESSAIRVYKVNALNYCGNLK